MDITFLIEYANLIALGICLCVGYIIKHLVPTDKLDRWIPLLMGLLGVALVVWIKAEISPEVLLTGLFSGLASTGLHQVFKQLITKKEAS